MRRSFRILPSLCHRITDVYRARQARLELNLPPISDDLLIEALTLPAASAGYNNQRLETLGDSVLKLCSTIHVFNRYPYRHEGQLSHLRQSCVSNRTLLARAKEIDLERFLTCEGQDVRSWRYIAPISELPPVRCVQRQFRVGVCRIAWRRLLLPVTSPAVSRWLCAQDTSLVCLLEDRILGRCGIVENRKDFGFRYC